MNNQDIRWFQRFNNFCKALNQLTKLLLPYTFDISIFQHISDPDLIDHINRVGIIFYERVRDFANKGHA